MVPGWAEHTQLSQWITPTISSPPPGTHLHPSSSLHTRYHSARILPCFCFPPQWENHHLPAQIPRLPLEISQSLSSSMLASQWQEAAPASLPHILLPEFFFPLSPCSSCPACVYVFVDYVLESGVASVQLPQMRLYFQWQVKSGHLICPHRQPWALFSPWPGTPRWASTWRKSNHLRLLVETVPNHP